MKYRKNVRLGRNKYGYIFGWPLILVMLALLIYPIVKISVMSFQNWYLLRPAKNGQFIAFNNFRKLFKDKYFIASVKKTCIYIAITVPIRYVLGYITALMLNRKFVGRTIARGIIVIPWAVPEVVTCLIWMLMMQKDYGIINTELIRFGLITSGIGWLTSTKVAMTSAVIVNIWKGFPFVAVMLLAGMQSVPADLYEAAMVDGASDWKQFWNITVPQLRPISAVVFMLLIVWTIRDYGIVYVLTGGGPTRATEILTIYMYKEAFDDFNYGIAAACGFLMMAVVLIFVIFYLKAQKQEGMEL